MTKKQAEKLIAKIQKLLKFQDVKIKLDFRDTAPDWAEGRFDNAGGLCWSHPVGKSAKIWISPRNCKNINADIREVILHEALESAFRDSGFKNTSDSKHSLINTLGEVLFELLFNKKAKSWLDK